MKLPSGTITEDREFSVEVVRCIGACGLAPVVTIDGKVHGRVKPEDIPDLIEALKKQSVISGDHPRKPFEADLQGRNSIAAH